ncbi:hypothetical protein J2Z49_002885 [Desulfofundulus luciae]|uniref:Uncharacterized protein n=2 Tax=Desulfofundulus luciae TaxID=74702 RepID=A0ABU0B654_9FIRM|nr:hypothetical protein [Desulfofundulus luciae]
MLSDSIRQEILDLMDRYGPETVLEAAEIAAGREYGRRGELGVALDAVEKALSKIKQAGEDIDKLNVAVEDLDRAVHRVRCAINGLWLLKKVG